MTRSVVCTGLPPCTTREKVVLQKLQRCLSTRYTRYTRYTMTHHAAFSKLRSIRGLICTRVDPLTPYTRYNPVLSGNVKGKWVEWDRKISRARSKGRRSA